MKEYKRIFDEAKQVGVLYHFTSFKGLLYILLRNEIYTGKFSTVSLTRNKNYNLQSRYGIGGMECRLTLDGDKLSENYKITPFKWSTGKDEFGAGDESEEQINRKIINLHKYLIEVSFNPNDLSYLNEKEQVIIENTLDQLHYHKYDDKGPLSEYYLIAIKDLLKKEYHSVKLNLL